MIPQPRFDFIKWSYIGIIFSIMLIIISSVIFIKNGMNFSIDFKGGIIMEINVPDRNISEVRTTFKDAGYANAIIQSVDNNKNNFIIKLLQQDQDVPLQDEFKILQKLVIEKFGESTQFRRIDYVGPKVGEALVKNSLYAILVSFLGILFYISFRFTFFMGIAAVMALIHDLIILLCLYVISRLEFSLASVAVMVLILGYSINDTIVIFNRIRENSKKYNLHNSQAYFKLISLSIDQMLKRTIMTSFATLVVALSIALVGGEGLRDFGIALCVGIIAGTYSSIFIASPIVGYLNAKFELQKS